MNFAAAPSLAAAALAEWYAHHGRHHLPWRQTRDPYAIWISEVMLQQTQVATVLARFYHPFLARFPDLAALAAADESEVMKAWQGLGYYSRARNLHRAARLAAPGLPRDAASLHALPGIGRNTAHAVAAFAYGEALPVVEANVKRVLHRMLGAETLPEKALWTAASALLGSADPFTHNQAMMDVGSQICTPRRPRCADCPLAVSCSGRTAPERYPAAREKRKIPTRRRRFVVLRDPSGRLHLDRRDARLLGGLYGFPEYEAEGPIVVAGRTYPPETLRHLGTVHRTYTHFRLEAEILLAGNATQALAFYSADEIGGLALSGLEHQILSLVGTGQLAAI